VRAFVTGASGFVGGFLTRHLRDAGDEVEAMPDGIDIADGEALLDLVRAARPEVVYHLAALAHVGRSWEEPAETMRVNALGTLSVLEAARRVDDPPRVLIISSAEVYGAGSGEPLDENAPLRPTNPYAASKVAAEFLGLQAHLGRGSDVVRVRPFNHVGPGQADAFVVSALAKRIVAAERSGGPIEVGNLEAARDFTDVRDVVRAYRLLALHGAPGEVYNVASGHAITIAELLERLLARSETAVEPVAQPSLFRPVDVPVLVGDSSRLAALTGWRPEVDLDETLAAVLEYWRSH